MSESQAVGHALHTIAPFPEPAKHSSLVERIERPVAPHDSSLHLETLVAIAKR